MNFIAGEVRHTNGRAEAVSLDGTVLGEVSAQSAEEGRPVYYGLRPEHFQLTGESDGLPFDISVVEPTGAEVLVVGRLGGSDIQVAFKERHDLRYGQRIYLKPQPEMAHVFDRESGNVLR
jgi:multiple sugar transport system ATP-binding protein